MDPLVVLAAGFAAANSALTLAGKVWDSTPEQLKIQEAADWGRFCHNISTFILDIQEKINTAVK